MNPVPFFVHSLNDDKISPTVEMTHYIDVQSFYCQFERSEVKREILLNYYAESLGYGVLFVTRLTRAEISSCIDSVGEHGHDLIADCYRLIFCRFDQ